MKKEKGITLISLTIYIILFAMIVETVVLFNTDFYSQVTKLNNDNISAEEYNKFNVNFVKDVKESKTATIVNNSGNTQITLDNGVNYYYISDEQAIYREKIKIASKITTFSATKITHPSKNVIRITIITGNDDNKHFQKTISYVFNYWS